MIKFLINRHMLSLIFLKQHCDAERFKGLKEYLLVEK